MESEEIPVPNEKEELEKPPDLGTAITNAFTKSDQAATVVAEKVTHGARKTIFFIGLGVAALGTAVVLIYRKLNKK